MHSLPSRTRSIARLLDPHCPRPEAARLFAELARNGRLLRFLAARPHHRVAPVLARRLTELDLPDESPGAARTRAVLAHRAEACAVRNELLRAQLARAISVLARRGITVCLMKGAVSLTDDVPAGYLPAAVRRMEDLDLVVRPEQGDRARELIAEQGWLCVSGTQPVPFCLDAPALVDLHVWSPRSAEFGFLPADAFFERALPCAVGGCHVLAPAPRHTVQLRLAHNVIRQHLFIDFPLLDLAEMACAVRARPDAVDWDGLRSVGLLHDVAPIFYGVLTRLREELGAPIPERMVPAVDRAHVRRVTRLVDRLAPAPGWLYGAASRLALTACARGRFVDRVNRAGAVLLAGPLAARRNDSVLTRAALPVRMLALHAAACLWTRARGGPDHH